MIVINGFSFAPNLCLQECTSSELIPVFEVDTGYTKKPIFYYNGKLWGKDDFWTVEKIRSKLRRGHYTEQERTNIETNWMAEGDTIYTSVVEPYYWLNVHNSTPNGIVQVSCREDHPGETYRRFSFREREDAVSCTNAIIKLIYNEKRDAAECWEPQVIHVLPAYWDCGVAKP